MLINVLISIIFLWLFSVIFVWIDGLCDYIKDKFPKSKIEKSWASVEDMRNELSKNSRLRDKYLYIYRFFLHIKEFPRDLYYETKYFIQRGIRGYSDRDVWEFDYYLSDIIINGIIDLKKQIHGCPGDIVVKCKEDHSSNLEKSTKEWKRILDAIDWTFYITKKIQNNEYILIENYKERKKFEKKYKGKMYIMNDKEVKKYKEGWKYFQKYYFNLWD